MKKTIKIFALILVICNILCACSSKNDNKSEASSTTDTSIYELKQLDPDEVISQLETKYYVMGSYSSTKDIYMVIENKSDFNIDLHVKLTTYDETGNIIQVLTEENDSFEKSTKTVVWFYNCKDFSTLKYEFEVEQTTAAQVTSGLEYELTEGKDEIFITVTNKGSNNANVIGYLLLFNNDNLIHIDVASFEGSDFNLDVNESITKNFTKPHEYTRYEFILFGTKSSY